MRVTAADLYVLAADHDQAAHTLRLTAEGPGPPRVRVHLRRLTASMLRDYIALFGAGVASFLAPCLVPLLPAYLGIIVGESADAHDTAKAVPATLIFILGFATVFAGFGVAAGFVGRSLSPVQDVVQRVGGAVIILFGLALLGVAPRSARPRTPADHDAAQAQGPSPPVRRRRRVRRGLEPVRRAAARRGARGRRPLGPAGPGRLLLLSYALGIGVPFLVASLGLASSPSLARLDASHRTATRTAGRRPAHRPRRPARDRRLPDAHVVSRPVHPGGRRAVVRSERKGLLSARV